jgi:hypothetical protein
MKQIRQDPTTREFYWAEVSGNRELYRSKDSSPTRSGARRLLWRARLVALWQHIPFRKAKKGAP